MAAQLDFFDLLKPTADVLAFPPQRMTRAVIDAAHRVYAAGPNAGQALLNEAGRIQLRYSKLGFDNDHAYDLATDFEQAVIAQVHRLRWLGSRRDPRGVA